LIQDAEQSEKKKNKKAQKRSKILRISSDNQKRGRYLLLFDHSSSLLTAVSLHILSVSELFSQIELGFEE
jgi:hypothetical protein